MFTISRCSTLVTLNSSNRTRLHFPILLYPIFIQLCLQKLTQKFRRRSFMKTQKICLNNKWQICIYWLPALTGYLPKNRMTSKDLQQSWPIKSFRPKITGWGLWPMYQQDFWCQLFLLRENWDQTWKTVTGKISSRQSLPVTLKAHSKTPIFPNKLWLWWTSSLPRQKNFTT